MTNGPVCCPRDLARFSLDSPVGAWYAAHVSNWAWVLFGGAVTLAAAAVVVLWQAFKHLDLKIERLGDRLDKKFDDQRNHFDQKLDDQRNYFDKKFDDQRVYFDQKFDQLMGSVAEVSRLVAGHDAQIKAQEKQIDRLSGAVFAPPRFDAPSPHQEGEHASKPVTPAEGAHASGPTAPAEAAGPGEGVASSTGGPEPTPPPVAIAPA